MKLRSMLVLAFALLCAPALAQVSPGTSPLPPANGGTGYITPEQWPYNAVGDCVTDDQAAIMAAATAAAAQQKPLFLSAHCYAHSDTLALGIEGLDVWSAPNVTLLETGANKINVSIDAGSTAGVILKKVHFGLGNAPILKGNSTTTKNLLARGLGINCYVRARGADAATTGVGFEVDFAVSATFDFEYNANTNSGIFPMATKPATAVAFNDRNSGEVNSFNTITVKIDSMVAGMVFSGNGNNVYGFSENNTGIGLLAQGNQVSGSASTGNTFHNWDSEGNAGAHGVQLASGFSLNTMVGLSVASSDAGLLVSGGTDNQFVGGNLNNVVDTGTGSIYIGTTITSGFTPSATTTWINKYDGTNITSNPYRELLTAARGYFVRSDGSDTLCTGKANAAAASAPACAFLTYARALTVITTLIDFGGQNVTLTNGNIATITTGIALNSSWTGGGNLVFDLGAQTVNATSGVSIGINAPQPGTINIFNGTIKATNASGLSVNAPVTVLFGSNLNFGTVGGSPGSYHMQTTAPGALINKIGVNYTISGNAGGGHMLAADQGQILSGLGTITCSGSPSFGVGFASGIRAGMLQDSSTTFSSCGTATGPRYSAATNSIIDTQGGGPNYFPGNQPGVLTSGGCTDAGCANVALVKIQTFCPSGCTTTIAGGATGTYTPSAGTLAGRFRCAGGGGGGGGTATTAAATGAGGAGGGAGSIGERVLSASAIGASLTVAIGAAGTAGTAGNNAGGNGGDSCFTTSTCTSGQKVAGKGGTGGGGSSGGSAPTPGAGGVVGAGDIPNSTGQPGGGFPALSGALGYGGYGGSTAIGGGAAAIMSSTPATGNAATGPGGGGGGGATFNASGTAAGGAGFTGYCEAQEFTNQ